MLSSWARFTVKTPKKKINFSQNISVAFEEKNKYYTLLVAFQSALLQSYAQPQEKTYEIIKSSHQLDLPSPITQPRPCQLAHVSLRHHLPGQPVPVLHHPFCEEILSDVQPQPPLLHLEAVSLCPATCPLGEGTNTSSLQPPLREVQGMARSPLSLPCPRLGSSSSRTAPRSKSCFPAPFSVSLLSPLLSSGLRAAVSPAHPLSSCPVPSHASVAERPARSTASNVGPVTLDAVLLQRVLSRGPLVPLLQHKRDAKTEVLGA